MTRISLFIIVIVVLAGALTGSAQTTTPIPEATMPVVTNRIMVRFAEMSPTTLGDITAKYGLTVSRVIPRIAVYVFETPPGQASLIVGQLNKLAAVKYAELVGVAMGEQTPNDPDYWDRNKVYAPQKINAPTAWSFATGSGVVVAVLDTGLSLAHPEFSGRIVPGYNFIGNTSDVSDDNGHGTHVAGVIAMGINNGIGSVGIAPDVKIMPVKVLDSRGYGGWDVVAEGIIFATDHGAKVINLSLSGLDNSQALVDALDYAVVHEVLLVAAAGNGGSDQPRYPAWYDQTMAVSATTPSDKLFGLSTWGDWVDVSAPGDAIWSAWWTNKNPNGYTFGSGTSAAAPHVAGLAALIWSDRSELSVTEVRTLIEATALDLGAPGFDPYFGHGRIDAGAALRADKKMIWLPLVR